MSHQKEGFFWNKTFIERFYKTKNVTAKKEIPGYLYCSTIIAFDELHGEGGELYREFLKGDCEVKIGVRARFLKRRLSLTQD